jgi:hypothetical protein
MVAVLLAQIQHFADAFSRSDAPHIGADRPRYLAEALLPLVRCKLNALLRTAENRCIRRRSQFN